MTDAKPYNANRMWFAAKDARDFVATALDKEPPDAAQDIVEWCAADLLASRCIRILMVSEGNRLRTMDNQVLTASFWEGARASGSICDWLGGKFFISTFDVKHTRRIEHRAFGVGFCEEDIRALLPPSTLRVEPTHPHLGRTPPRGEREFQPPRLLIGNSTRGDGPPGPIDDGAPLPGFTHKTNPERMEIFASGTWMPPANLPLTNIDNAPNRGGRPSADFWMVMCLEIAHRIHEGNFRPATQTEVVDAMQRWLIDHGYQGGLTKTKECARKVFKLFG